MTQGDAGLSLSLPDETVRAIVRMSRLCSIFDCMKDAALHMRLLNP